MADHKTILNKYVEFIVEVDALSDNLRRKIITILENKDGELNIIEKEILPVLKDKEQFVNEARLVG